MAAILAVYAVAVYGGIGVGPLLLLVYPFSDWQPFSLAGILIAAAAVPVLGAATLYGIHCCMRYRVPREGLKPPYPIVTEMTSVAFSMEPGTVPDEVFERAISGEASAGEASAGEE